MPVTWYWERPGQLAHARLNDDKTTLCGTGLPSEGPLMRPPFPAVRCATCEELRGIETEVFPNKYLFN